MPLVAAESLEDTAGLSVSALDAAEGDEPNVNGFEAGALSLETDETEEGVPNVNEGEAIVEAPLLVAVVPAESLGVLNVNGLLTPPEEAELVESNEKLKGLSDPDVGAVILKELGDLMLPILNDFLFK